MRVERDVARGAMNSCASRIRIRASMFRIDQYGAMFANPARIEAYRSALRRCITPDSVVLDIGTGTGAFALIACSLGARKVYGIEPSHAVELAREIAYANGFAGRTEFIRDVSTNVSLPERADVIVSDLGDVLPLFGEHIPAIVDARERFLAEDGVLIAQRDWLRAAIVEASVEYDRLRSPWTADVLAGLDMSSGWKLVSNTLNYLHGHPVVLLTPPIDFAAIEYATVTSPDVSADLTSTVAHRGTGHGWAIWFDRLVADQIRISNEPGGESSLNTSRVYKQLFLAWPEPVLLEPGDLVTGHLAARLMHGDYVWRWDTMVRERETRRLKAEFVQSSLLSLPLSRETLPRGGHVKTTVSR